MRNKVWEVLLRALCVPSQPLLPLSCWCLNPAGSTYTPWTSQSAAGGGVGFWCMPRLHDSDGEEQVLSQWVTTRKVAHWGSEALQSCHFWMTALFWNCQQWVVYVHWCRGVGSEWWLHSSSILGWEGKRANPIAMKTPRCARSGTHMHAHSDKLACVSSSEGNYQRTEGQPDNYSGMQLNRRGFPQNWTWRAAQPLNEVGLGKIQHQGRADLERWSFCKLPFLISILLQL